MIEGRKIAKSYGEVDVFSSVSFRFETGARCAVLGPSGCGKTTLLRILAGLESIDAGELLLDGRDWVGAAPHERGLAFLFQSPALWPHMTVVQNALFAMDVPDLARVVSLLEQAGIAETAERYPHEVSGGQARRAALVRALAPRKPILLLDEPGAHLGPGPVEAVWELIEREASATGATVITAVHGAEEAARLGGPVLELPAQPGG